MLLSYFLKVSRRPLTSSDDGQWSEGLISAARLVAAATHSLVESANSLVQGMASEEKLISSAKQVASSTAQLLVACKVKADPDADSTKRLQVRTVVHMYVTISLSCVQIWQ
jgi:talin